MMHLRRVTGFKTFFTIQLRPKTVSLNMKFGTTSAPTGTTILTYVTMIFSATTLLTLESFVISMTQLLYGLQEKAVVDKHMLPIRLVDY